MRASVAVDHTAAFAGRLATAFVELALAAAIIVAAVFVGHDLREWRDWYPTSYHPWLGEQLAPDVSEP